MIVWCLNDQLSAMASCLEKNFGTFFNFGYFFCGLQATVSDFGQKTSYCQIRLKKLHSPTKHLEKNLKFSKIFFLNLFRRQLVIFSELQLPSLWNRAWSISNFFQIWSFLILLGDFRQNVREFIPNFRWFRP